MPLTIQDLHKVDKHSFPYIYEENATVKLKSGPGLVRCNVYRPQDESKTYPVLVTYGPYGKDIPYKEYNLQIKPLHRFHLLKCAQFPR